MSKRKNRNSSPNLPQATLDRARQQLGATPPPTEPEDVIDSVEADAQAEPEVVLTPVQPRPDAPKATASPRTTRRRSEPVQVKGGRKESYDVEVIKNRLEHPTRVVTEAELRQDYNYVVKDLRSMGLLAALLIVAMVILSFIS